MNKQKILFLGASANQIPPILYAKNNGYYIITCDNIPSNPGHIHAHETFDISTVDKEAVLELAAAKKVDAVVAYASDPSAPTVAYVGNRLGLPSNPYDSVSILVDKTRYRQFLRENGFNYPKFVFATNVEEALLRSTELSFPLMVKPADSSGSKGVRKVTSIKEIQDAFVYAQSFSRNNKVIIEQYVQMKGFQTAGDAFIVDGKIAFYCFANEHFNEFCNPHVPIGESFPSILHLDLQKKIVSEINRLLNLLDMKNGAINIDARIGENNEIYLMEIGPRNGGNIIPEVIQHCTGVDLIEYTIKSAIGKDCSSLKMTLTKGFYASYIIHSDKDGLFKRLSVDSSIKHKIVDMKLLSKKDQQVFKFNGSQFSLGSMILQFENIDEMLHSMRDLPRLVCVEVT